MCPDSYFRLLNKEMESMEEGRQRASVPMSEQLPAT